MTTASKHRFTWKLPEDYFAPLIDDNIHLMFNAGMKLEDIPDLRGNQYAVRISVAVSSEVKKKLDELKRVQRKDTSVLIRMLIDEFLKGIEQVFSA